MKKNSSYYLTLTVVNWIDVFTRKNHKDTIIESLRYCIENKGLNIYAYCLMTNHLHLIVNCDDPYKLKDTIRDFKRHTAKQPFFQIQNEAESRREWLMRLFKEAGERSSQNENLKFWQTGNHAIELYTEKFVWDKINYIHNNPVEENFVSDPANWKYSSASNYLDDHGILEEVYCLTPRLRTVK
ncbi:MAG: transposase [Crocinitomicaceae bacterium]